jgi:hypothetical protein
MLRRAILCCLVSLGAFAQQPGIAPPKAAGEFQISGTVVDSAGGQPLSNTRVAIAPVSQRDAFTTVVTGDDGRFFFPSLAPGKYTLTAQRRGYLTQAFNQHEQFSSSIAVGPDLESGNLVFRLTRECAISGTVIDEHGDPLRDAQVTLFQSALSGGSKAIRQRAVAITDNEGSYRFAHLQSGRYFIAVAGEPWYAQRPTPPNNANTFVADGNNLNVSSVGVSAGKPEPVPAAEEPPSPLDVAYPVTFYSGVTDAASASAIVLGSGGTVSADVTLHPVPALHIRVVAGNSDPEQQFYGVLQERVFGGVFIHVRTQSVAIAPGVMEMQGVAPGHYIMKTNGWSGSQFQPGQEREVDVTGNGELDTTRSSSFAPFTATFHFEAAAPARTQAFIQLRDKKSARFFGGRFNDKNEAEIQEGVAPGSYEVSFQTNQDVFIKSLSATGGRVTGRTLDIKGSGPVKLSLVVAQGEGTVRGTALREDKPIAGVMVLLAPADPANNQALFRRDQSDSDGTFTLANVVPGRYTVLAIQDGWDLEWTNPEVLKKFMAQGEPVVVETRGKYSVKVKVQ